MAKKRLSEYVVEWRRQQGESLERLAFKIGVGRSTLEGYIRSNEWPKDCIPKLAEALGLPRKLWRADAIEGEYTVKRWKEARLKRAVPRDFESTLEAIDQDHGETADAIERIGGLTRSLFRHMNDRHFLVSSSSGASLLILQDSDIGREQRDNRFSALDNGLLWALITPTPEYLSRLKDEYTIDFTPSYRKFATGFDKLRAAYVEHLRKKNESENLHPEEDADMRMQRLEWGDFPFTPLRWTVSLLGECPPGRKKIYRAIVRAPYERTHSYQVFPGGNQFFEIDLLTYFRHIITTHYESAQAKGDGDPAIRRRRDFCDKLLGRMDDS